MAATGWIEPDEFDVIVVGTGLPESILAAAAAASRHSVLHLDPHDFYGDHWASLNFAQISSWAACGGCFLDSQLLATTIAPNSSSDGVIRDSDSLVVDSSLLLEELSLGNGSDETSIGPGIGSDDHGSHGSATELADGGALPSEPLRVVEGAARSDSAPEELGFEEVELELGKSLFSRVKVREFEGVSLGSSRSYSIDLAGPKLTFCGSILVNLLLRCGASHYVEFKGVDASYIWKGDGISAVPSSRADVFKDKSLSLPDKRYLMRFFKLVTDYATSEDQSIVDISVEDLDGPFVHFMQRQLLPASIQSIILYAIALVDDDQQYDGEGDGSLLKTRDGLQKLALYLSSVARFPNAPGAFIYPLYGQGELPQAFCRSAAVNGALYVLRRPVDALLVDKDSKEYKGVRTVQGQVLYSKRLIMGPSVVLKSGHGCDLPSLAGLDTQSEGNACLGSSTSASTTSPDQQAGSHVARCICITDRSLSEVQSTLLVIFPPRSVHGRWSTAIRALQLSSAASVCPEGKYLVQLSTICSDSADGQEALEAAVQALFSSSEDGTIESVEAGNEVHVPSKPKLLWLVSYVQTLQTAPANSAIPGVALCGMPDGTLDGESVLASVEKLFRELFPGKVFFPQPAAAEDGADDTDTE